MMKYLYNAGYFFKETITMIRLNIFSHVFSLISTGLIFFILAMVISGWWVSDRVIEAIRGEAEVSLYYNEKGGRELSARLTESIRGIQGVREARVVGEKEALARMEEILGKEARVLEYFDENPFSSFIEIKINLEEINPVLEKLEMLPGVEYIRDNREVLDRLHNIAGAMKVLGVAVLAGVGFSTLMIISHVIRLGIYNNREEINTLRLLGAPRGFIAIPFLLKGMLLTMAGGVLAAVFGMVALKEVYMHMAGPLPFIPLPPRESLSGALLLLLPLLGAVVGLVGSVFGLLSARSN